MISNEFFDFLKQYIAYRSISSDPLCSSDMQKTAEFLHKTLDSFGFTSQSMGAEFPIPIVCARRESQNSSPKGTLLIYGHYDVQPIEPAALWETEPFTLSEKDNAWYGRGISDDKGPHFLLLWSLQKFLHQHSDFPYHIQVVLEGEEEIGSVHFKEFLQRYRNALTADAILVVDTGCSAEHLPSLTTGLRSLVHFELTLRTAPSDLHSGYGGSLPNALHEMVALLVKLHDENGAVMVPHFYDDVDLPTAEILESFQFLEQNEASFTEEFHVRGGYEVLPFLRKVRPDLAKLSLLKRSFHALLPSLEIHGIFGGHTGEGIKTIIPAEAHAKMTARLVASQRPKKVLEYVTQFLQQQVSPFADLQIQADGCDFPYAIDMKHTDSRFLTVFHAAGKALQSGFSGKVLQQREGGSIGVVSDMKSILGADSVLIGIVPPAAAIHAPNENMTNYTLEHALSAFDHFWELLGNEH